MDVLSKLMGGILPQYICLSIHHIIYFNSLIIFLSNYTSVKLKKKKVRKEIMKGGQLP